VTTFKYAGDVYCAEVPGGLIYTRDPGSSTAVWTGNSLKVGVDGQLTRNAHIGRDNKLYIPVKDREGAEKFVTPGDLADATLAIGPSSTKGYDVVVRGGKMQMAQAGTADYRIPDAESLYGHAASIVPLKKTMFGQRSGMAARMSSQALPIDNPEAPLVQTGVPGTEYDSFEARAGEIMGAVRAKSRGRVIKAAPDQLTVQYADGTQDKISLDNNRPGARKSVFHHTPMVQVGQQFAPGQLLAKSNFTDDEGVAALGKNFNTALMAWGDNWEDGIIVSQSAADAMRVQQAYKYGMEKKDGNTVGKKDFVVRFGNIYDAKQLDAIDDDGVIRPGTTVRRGDPLLLAVREKNEVGNRVHRQGKLNFSDASLTWDHQHDGVVTDIYNDEQGKQVVVRTSSPLEVGSKVSGRAGNKGVVTVMPDSEMPIDARGERVDMVISPLAVPSRGNSEFPIEMLLAKAAKARGRAYRVEDRDDRDAWQYAVQEAEKYGVPVKEDVTDPKTGRKIKGVNVGPVFTMALSHTAESKVSSRGLGAYTCFDDQTEALTDRGWVPWPEVKDDDRLASVDADNRLVYEVPTAVARYAYKGKLCGFTGRYIDYLVTPNHRMWVRNTRRKGKEHQPNQQYRFVQAAYLPSRKRGWATKQAGMLPDAGSNPVFYTIPGVPRPKHGGLGSEDVHIEAGDYAELVGWFLSEGLTTYNKKWREWNVTISQCEHINPDDFKRIRWLLDRLPFKYSIAKASKKYPESGRRGFRIRSKQLYLHLSQFGKGCQNKFIPRFLLEASVPVRRRLFDSLMAGDGSYQVTGTRTFGSYTTTSKRLADDVQELAMRLGVGGGIHIGKVADEENNVRTAYAVGLFLTRTDAFIGEHPRSNARFYEKPYVGYVYCATVPSGLLVVRRNGKVLVTGNSENLPARGASDDAQAKRQSGQQLYSHLAHGAYETSREGTLLRGQRQDDYWAAFMSGNAIGMPQVSEQYEGLISKLKASGINPVRSGTKVQLMAMTDKDTEKLAGSRVVRVADTVDMYKDLAPIKGGLMDPAIFGDGDKFGVIELPTKIPNPVFETSIKRLLDLTDKQYRGVISGQEPLGKYGTGIQALEKRLSEIDVDHELEEARVDVRGSRKIAREKAVRRMQQLQGFKRSGVHTEGSTHQQSTCAATTLQAHCANARQERRAGKRRQLLVQGVDASWGECRRAEQTRAKRWRRDASYVRRT